MSKTNNISRFTSYSITGSLLARNTLLNFIGQVVPLLVGVVAIPFIIQGLGTKRFGLLSLAWVVLGYFTIFDLGLGRATTKYVAEALGNGDEDQVPRLVWTAVTIQTVLGIVGALILVSVTPLLVKRILNIPPELVSEAKDTFYLLAISLPIVLVSSSFSGALEAAQRFDLVNAVRVPSSISTHSLSLVGVLLELALPGIVALILIARFATLLALVILVLRIFPKARKFSVEFALFAHLFAYGVWVTVTSIVGPVLVYFDRFLIASLLSMAAVAYYTAPYEVVARLCIISASLVMTLFPTFSSLEAMGDRKRLEMLFARSVKYVLLAVSPIMLVLILFGRDILQLWLGSDFATQSVVVLQILALGILVNSLAQSPYALLQGVGRPDIPAKFHLLELPLYFGIAWVFTSRWGIVGAAIAWTVRSALDTLLLFIAAFRVGRFSPRLLRKNSLMLTSLALLLLAGLAYGLKGFTGALPLLGKAIVFATLFSLSAWIFWRNVLDASDRDVVIRVVRLWRR